MEERAWGGVDALRTVAEVVKWPFERIVWTIERGLVWPLEERTGEWSGPLRAAGIAAMALLAAGAGVFGLVWASGSGGGSAQIAQRAPTPLVAPAAAPTPKESLAQAAPVLHGPAPDFTPKAGGGGASGASTAKPPAEATETGTSPATETATGSSVGSAAAKVVPVGPAATKVARQFAGGFVLYETGRDDAKVRTAFAATATPELARELLRRPPRLPADVKVPKAKVLNLVPGPVHGETHTLSVSLLRLGVTSELRVDMQLNPKSGEWQVTDVRG
ncbi:MAG TPA: hypothetical protein VGN84_06545 [Solirubrobacterales bacterium]|nr:hypothetical protein [Solirubrobacterales bacterium]